ncbi:fibronectin type III domain-containing protein [Paenibacillus sp. IB182496]|uniref:Fibronectin type III domain-containing protein n=1 Tax=Paenibacillus sabuli TaxID=2772509 RepID=A0A927BY31_9BACL|nr:fibronectin type III domain-containing protein [Paenibacillus sabuli]MBD2847524.1 fibronectin type III domain-containing protein [Paenibacillus sabuli]
MGTLTFVIKDHVKHANYSWPSSMVRYEIALGPGEAHRDALRLTDQEERAVPFQLEAVQLEGAFVRQAAVCWITSLPPGAAYRYTLHYTASPAEDNPGRGDGLAQEDGRVHDEDGSLARNETAPGLQDGLVASPLEDGAAAAPAEVLTNGKLCLRWLEGDGLSVFELGTPAGRSLAAARLVVNARLLDVERVCIAAGPIYQEHVLHYRFEGERTYRLTLRLTTGMDFVEMDEAMAGFAPKEEARLELDWSGWAPHRRFTRYRGEERIDRYAEADGRLPFSVLPFDSWISWHGAKTASFVDPELRLGAGVFALDTLRWDDGAYALWRSPEAMALRFYYRREPGDDAGRRLVWTYPLVQGSRATALALYDWDPEAERARQTVGGVSDKEVRIPSYVDELWLWHTLLPLNKVKDWVFEWEEDRAAYPRALAVGALPPSLDWWYFHRDGPPQPSDVGEMIGKLSYGFHHIFHTAPVSSREFSSWAALFDLAAGAMTAAEFDRWKAASVLMAYVREDENVMPTRTLLGGHPNFLMDIKAVPGFMAALFPHHPHARRWREDFERAVALNLKYHTRPAVARWEAQGGRWTENLGCYVWAALKPMLRAAWMLRTSGADNVLLYPNLLALARWLRDSLSAPVDGARTYPPQGAHSGVLYDPIAAPYELRVLGELIMRYEPLLGEELLALSPEDAPGFESHGKQGVWRQMLEPAYAGNRGTRPELRSAKYTGYGYILRAAVHTPSEMSVHLQQLDEGPNYRWGRAAEGGCGTIYYYADGKRYSYNRPEDVGDANMGDVAGSCNFGVLDGHAFRSVGRHELTEPLHDFGFAQFAQVNAGPYAQPMYRSRSVLMSGNDYIVIYDEVADMRVFGRFAWFGHQSGPLPDIYQLKPGAAGVAATPGLPIDKPPGGPAEGQSHGHRDPGGARGKVYDGYGDFLTVVTHRTTWQPQLTEVQETPYGARIVLSGRTDYVFRDSAEIVMGEESVRFRGYAGIVREHASGLVEAALFRGTRIGAGGVELTLADASGNGAGAGGVSFVIRDSDLTGASHLAGPCQAELSWTGAQRPAPGACLTIGGEPASWETTGEAAIRFLLPAGACAWQWSERPPAPARTIITGTEVSAGAVKVCWAVVPGATGYDVAISRDEEASWESRDDAAHEAIQESAASLQGIVTTLQGLEDGTKLHVRVRALCAEQAGAWSASYPVYVTAHVPEAPEGLRLSREGAGIRATWGMLLGVERYCLYRRPAGAARWEPIYRGGERTYTDAAAGDDASARGDVVYEYCVSAVNGNGEGPLSLPRDTAPGGLIDWDPRPDETFRRDTRSNEYGFSGFDYWANRERGSLDPYPD